MFIRGQRNPLLDRIDFYNRQQDKGESFDSFYTSLRELYNVSDFSDLNLCQRCSAAICGQCETQLQKVKEDMMRDRIVTGIGHDEVRHKLLSQTDLTLRDAIRICRAEEAATKTEDGMALPMPMNVMKMSNYRRQKQNRDVTKIAAEEEKKATANRDVKTAVGIFIHIQNAQLLIKGVTNARNLDIFT